MDLRAQKRRSILAIGSSTTLDQTSSNQQPRNIPDYRMKLVTVGDGGTGKTCMLIRYLHGQFNEAYVPTVFENYSKTLKKDGKRIDLALWDTAGQEEYDRLRALSYPETDVVLVCFSVGNPITLENAFDKWIPEIQTYCPGIPYILVGCKSDTEEREISYQTGLDLAAERGAHAYIECSSKTGDHIEEPFQEAVRAVLKPYDKRINKQRQVQQKQQQQKQPKRKVSFPNYRNTQQQQQQGQTGGRPTRQDRPGTNTKPQQTPQGHGNCCLIL